MFFHSLYDVRSIASRLHGVARGVPPKADLRPAPSGICTEDAVVVVAEVDVAAQQRRDGLVVELRLVDVLVHEHEVRAQRARATEVAREQQCRTKAERGGAGRIFARLDRGQPWTCTEQEGAKSRHPPGKSLERTSCLASCAFYWALAFHVVKCPLYLYNPVSDRPTSSACSGCSGCSPRAYICGFVPKNGTLSRVADAAARWVLS